jgi:hypothetical protein
VSRYPNDTIQIIEKKLDPRAVVANLFWTAAHLECMSWPKPCTAWGSWPSQKKLWHTVLLKLCSVTLVYIMDSSSKPKNTDVSQK